MGILPDSFAHIQLFKSSMSEVGDNKGGNGEVPENAQDLTIFVQNLLEQMVSGMFDDCLPLFPPSYYSSFAELQQQRFNQMSTSIIGRIDEMGNRIDDLEKSIGDLMQQVSSCDSPANHT